MTVLRTVWRIAFRDFTRRPLQSLLVVGGLLVASLVMSSALVAGDAMEQLFLENTYRAWDTVDVSLSTSSGEPFPMDTGAAIANDAGVAKHSDGYSLVLNLRGSAENTRQGTRERSIRVWGVDPNQDASLGAFVSTEGKVFKGLAGNRAAINQRLASRLDARVGDTVRVLTTGFDAEPLVIEMVVASILRNEGKADAGRAAAAFVAIDHLQEVSNSPRLVTHLRLSANGGPRNPRDSRELQAAAARAAGRAARDGTTPEIVITDSKSEDLASAKEQTKFFRAILGMLGAIVALASIALISNLFVMLGEERRGEQGALRALGLKRRGLILLGIIEGMLYSATAAVAGSFLGAFFGRFLARSMSELFKSFTIDSSFEFATPPFTVRPATLIQAGLAGFAVAMFSVIFVSIRTSRLNVITAIRGLSEDGRVKRRRIPLLSILSALAGASLLQSGIARDRAEINVVVGGALLILAAGSIASRYLGKRTGGSVGGLAGLAWGFWTNAYLPDFDRDPNYAFALVTLTGVIAVGAGVGLIAANVSAFKHLSFFFGARTKAILRTAASYAAGYRFRTAMSMAMFAFVTYMIAAFAIWGGFGGGADYRKHSGGYDVLADSTVPLEKLELGRASSVAGMHSAVYTRGYRVGASEDVRFPARLLGIDESFAAANRFKFSDKEDISDKEAWNKVARSDDLAIIDQATNPGGAEPGEDLVIKTDKGVRKFRVVGIAEEFVLNAIFISKDAFQDLYPSRASDTMWLIKGVSGIDEDVLARDVERKYASQGMDAQSIKSIYEERSEAQRTFVGIFQLLLKMGLVIGISGLAIGSVRTVLERKQAIGTLRAIGFRVYMVGSWLLIETVLVATLGVALGLGIGLTSTWWLIERQIEGFSFSVDWPQIQSALTIIYSALVLFTALPVWRAARMRPSEAVRYVE